MAVILTHHPECRQRMAVSAWPRRRYNPLLPEESIMQKLFDSEMRPALEQLMDETIEALQLAKVSPDIDDLGATMAVALLKLGLATSFVEQKYSGFARDVEEKRQRVLSAMMPKH